MHKIFVLLIVSLIFSVQAYGDVIPTGYKSVDKYIDKSGHKIKPTQEQIEKYRDKSNELYLKGGLPAQFSEGFILAEDNNNYGFKNEKGEWIIPPKYMDICKRREFPKGIKGGRSAECAFSSFFNEGLAPIKYDEKPVFYIEHVPSKKEVVIPEDFEIIKDENAIYFNGQYTVYAEEKDGKYYIKKYPTKEEKSSLTKGTIVYIYKRGYIDKNGKIVIETKYPVISPFSDGMAIVCASYKQCGYIDKTGKTVIKPKYRHVGYFIDGMANVYYMERADSKQLLILLLFIIGCIAFYIKRTNRL